MSGVDIFISYSREDRPAARRFAECFAEEGFSVWWDAALHSGETFDEVIERQLRDSKAVVVLWSPRSVVSRWVRAEATLADRRNKLAPAIIEPCDRPIIFELTHAADLSDWTGDTNDIHWRTFVEDLHRLVEAGNDPEALASRSAPKPQAPAKVHSAPPASERSPVARRPLRPGNDEVILSPRGKRMSVFERAAGGRTPQPGTPPEAEEEIPEVAGDIHLLEIDDEEMATDSFVISAAGAKIGRTEPADIVIPHKSVSREHCVVGLANDELLVTDLNSTNGTYIDGQRIGRATILPVGSVLKVGHVTLRHEIRSNGDTFEQDTTSGAKRSGGWRSGRFALTS